MSLHKTIQKYIVDKEHGQSEVMNTFGRADVVTAKEIIEISEMAGYKEALGRVNAYCSSLTFASRNLSPRIHIYIGPNESYEAFEKKIQQILDLCHREYPHVKVSFGNNDIFFLEHKNDLKKREVIKNTKLFDRFATQRK